MKRWTIKELKNIDTIDFSIEILKERRSTLTNCYSPLYEKISKTINELKLLKEEK